MKSYNHLYEQFLSKDNYLLAVHNATAHKSGRKKKYQRAKYYQRNAELLAEDMMNYAENFYNYPHKPVLIYDGIRRKQRAIIVPHIREQIVHHMIINVMKPIFMKPMYEHSYGSIPGRGPHTGKKTMEKWIRKGGSDVKYCLKLDVKKFFDSIPHDIMKDKFSKIIHDEKFLEIVNTVVDANGEDVGIPIGFYTSQWFANFYLQDLDHYIKEVLGVKHYMRYMDDMVLFGSNKRQLHDILYKIRDYLRTDLKLEIKGNWQIYRFDYIKKNGKRVGRDIDFMGFRFFRDRTILRKQLMLKAARKAKRVCKKGKSKNIHDVRQMLSYLGWIDCTDTYNMYLKRIKPYVSFKALKRFVSRHEKHNKEYEKCGTKLKTVIA